MLFAWIFIIPMAPIYLTLRHRSELDHYYNRLRYGFLYQEYKEKKFFWEFIKIFMRIIIVFLGNFFSAE